MKRFILKLLAICLVLLSAVAIVTLTVVDRLPYRQTAFYSSMDARLDSLGEHFRPQLSVGKMHIGWSQINITPHEEVPLAGYGARDPKAMQGVRDSSYVRTVVLAKGQSKLAIVTTDLLIIHPELRNAVFAQLNSAWQPSEIYFTASHTHSGQGGWAPGIVGGLFAGAYNEARVKFLAEKVLESIEVAEESLGVGNISVGELSADHLVRNRLAKENGILDPWLKAIVFQKENLKGLMSVFSAHATCFGPDNHQLTGDYPAFLNQLMIDDSTYQFATFAAGAVGSMAAGTAMENDVLNAQMMATGIKDQLALLDMIGYSQLEVPTIESFRLNLPLRAPYFKITNNLALRPYLFHAAFGQYQNDLSVAVLGKALFIGVPCDFSGELAVPLYEEARKLGYQLFITSFNGGYAGYVVKDEWYDMKKYEARTMSWHGPDTGAYLSEVIFRLIHIVHENNQTNTARR